MLAAAPVAGLAGLAAAKGHDGKNDGLEVTEWIGIPCPECERPVMFLPDQRENTCAWCKTKVVRHGLGR